MHSINEIMIMTVLTKLILPKLIFKSKLFFSFWEKKKIGKLNNLPSQYPTIIQQITLRFYSLNFHE